MNNRTHVELSPYLARFRRRLRLRSGLGFLQRTLWVACLAGGMILLARAHLAAGGHAPVGAGPTGIVGNRLAGGAAAASPIPTCAWR